MKPTLAICAAQAQLAGGISTRRVLKTLEAELEADEHIALAQRILFESGAKASDLLEVLATQFEYLESIDAEVQVALTTISITKQTLLWLPVLTCLIGQLSGFGTLAFLLTEPLGWFLLLVVTGLTFATSRLISRHISQSNQRVEDLSFRLSLVAVALEAGMNYRAAAALFSETDRLELAAYFSGQNFRHDDSLTIRAINLKAEARAIRNQSKLLKAKQVAQLPEKLIRSTGLLLLPACLLVTVVPAAIGVWRSSFAG